MAARWPRSAPRDRSTARRSSRPPRSPALLGWRGAPAWPAPSRPARADHPSGRGRRRRTSGPAHDRWPRGQDAPRSSRPPCRRRSCAASPRRPSGARPRPRARPRRQSARRSSSRPRPPRRSPRPRAGGRARGSAAPTSRRSRRTCLPSTSISSAPSPRATKIGSRPIARIARTGELTPPGISSSARLYSSAERVSVSDAVKRARAPSS